MHRTVKTFCCLTLSSAARADPDHKHQYGLNVTAFDEEASPKQQQERLEEAKRRLAPISKKRPYPFGGHAQREQEEEEEAHEPGMEPREDSLSVLNQDTISKVHDFLTTTMDCNAFYVCTFFKTTSHGDTISQDHIKNGYDEYGTIKKWNYKK